VGPTLHNVGTSETRKEIISAFGALQTTATKTDTSNLDLPTRQLEESCQGGVDSVDDCRT